VGTIKYNEKKKCYEIRYDAGYDGTGKRIQKYKGGFKKEKEAKAYLTDQEASVNHGTYIEPQKMFLFQYLNNWLEGREDELSLTTYSGYEINIRCHINPYIGGVRLQDLKAAHIKDLYKELKKDREIKVDGEVRHFKKLSGTSILYVHRVLSKALEDAYEEETIAKNPAKLAKPPAKDPFEAGFLTVEQIRETLNKFRDDEMYIPVYLSVVLGLRRGEVLGLLWENIDLKNKIIRIRKNYIMKNGRPVLQDKTKTDTSRRDIVITDRIVNMLKEHHKKQSKMKLELGGKYYKSDSDFVCTWPNGKPFSPSHVSERFKLRMKKYGLISLRFHDLRHSAASLMITQNVPMKGVSDRLGHSTIVITNDLYGHIERSVQEKIAEAVDKALWGE